MAKSNWEQRSVNKPKQSLYQEHRGEEFYVQEEPFYLPLGDEVELFEEYVGEISIDELLKEHLDKIQQIIDDGKTPTVAELTSPSILL